MSHLAKLRERAAGLQKTSWNVKQRRKYQFAPGADQPKRHPPHDNLDGKPVSPPIPLEHEQAEARRRQYVQSLGLNPIHIAEQLPAGTDFPQADGNILPHNDSFGLEHETAHAMMTPPGQRVDDYQKRLSLTGEAPTSMYGMNRPSAEEAVRIPEYQAHLIGTRQEDVANHLEYAIDRRAGVDQNFASRFRKPSTPQLGARYGMDSEALEERKPNGSKLQAGPNGNLPVMIKPIRDEAKSYVGQFDDGARFNAQGRIEQPKGIDATINRRAKTGSLAALREKAAQGGPNSWIKRPNLTTKSENMADDLKKTTNPAAAFQAPPAKLAESPAAKTHDMNGPLWLDRFPIVHPDHAHDLETNAAVNEFHLGMPRHEAERKSHDDYVRGQRQIAARFHYHGNKAALQAGDNEAARKHHGMYQLHMKALGEDHSGAPPAFVTTHMESDPQKAYKFKAHRADLFAVHDGAMSSAPHPDVITKSELKKANRTTQYAQQRAAQLGTHPEMEESNIRTRAADPKARPASPEDWDNSSYDYDSSVNERMGRNDHHDADPASTDINQAKGRIGQALSDKKRLDQQVANSHKVENVPKVAGCPGCGSPMQYSQGTTYDRYSEPRVTHHNFTCQNGECGMTVQAPLRAPVGKSELAFDIAWIGAAAAALIKVEEAKKDKKKASKPVVDDSHYRCAGCKRIVPNENGAADDMPDHCDDCWAKAHATEKGEMNPSKPKVKPCVCTSYSFPHRHKSGKCGK